MTATVPAKMYQAGVHPYAATYWDPGYLPAETDLLTDLEHYKGRAYRIEEVPGDPAAFYAFVAYPLDLFEEGSVVNVLTSLAGNVFGFKAIRSLRLEDIRFPLAYVLTCGGPPNGIRVERDKLDRATGDAHERLVEQRIKVAQAFGGDVLGQR